MALGPPLNLPHMCLQVKQKEHLKKSLERSKKKVRQLEVLFKDTIKTAIRETEKQKSPVHAM